MSEVAAVWRRRWGRGRCKGQWRLGRPAGRRAGRPAGECAGHRRRRGRHRGGAGGDGDGANVTVLDRSVPRLSYLDDVFMGRLTTQYATAGAIADLLPGRRHGHRRGAGAGGGGAGSRARSWPDEARLGAGRRGPSIRAAASRPRTRPRIRTRSMPWTGSCITAWRTCRARCRRPRPGRLAT